MAVSLTFIIFTQGLRADVGGGQGKGSMGPKDRPVNNVTQELLAKFELMESRFQTYVTRSTLVFYEEGEKQKSMELLLAVSQTSSLALMEKPAYDQGKVVLLNENGYFLYFPTPDRYIRISPQNSIYGNISFGDIVKPPLLRYYTLTSAENQNQRMRLTFTLKAGVRLPYFHKVVVIEPNRAAVLSIESYSRSGILLGKTVNLKFTSIDGIAIPIEAKVYDVRNPRSHAVQRSTALKVVELPEAFFTPAYLRRVDGYFERRLGM